MEHLVEVKSSPFQMSGLRDPLPSPSFHAAKGMPQIPSSPPSSRWAYSGAQAPNSRDSVCTPREISRSGSSRGWGTWGEAFHRHLPSPRMMAWIPSPRRTQDHWSRTTSDTEASSQSSEGRAPILKDGRISTSWSLLSGEEPEAQVA